MRSLHDRILAGELPFFARVSSTDGGSGQLVVTEASITSGGSTTVILNDKVTIATNTSKGDQTTAATAVISIPIDGTSAGAIKTAGNASVANEGRPAQLSLHAGARKMKKVSATGLFVIARIGTQRDTNHQFFDLLFGTVGQPEWVDDEGVKQRPHIALCHDGNGKFIRLAGHRCELEAEMTYLSLERRIAPKTVRLRSLDHQETVELRFAQESTDHVVLVDICFVDAR